jgi:hypothetical protein
MVRANLGATMDRATIEKTLAWMKPAAGQRVHGRRIKVYAASLDMNFYLKNPSGRRLSTAMLASLAYDGITSGWKKDVQVWSRDVYLLELKLIMLAQSQRSFSG